MDLGIYFNPSDIGYGYGTCWGVGVGVGNWGDNIRPCPTPLQCLSKNILIESRSKSRNMLIMTRK